MTFDEWWDKNETQYSSDSCHMSEYHMASVVWNAAFEAGRELERELIAVDDD